MNSKLNRNYYYSELGQMTSATAGNTILNGPGTGRTDGPYERTFQFNAFGNLTQHTDRTWSSFGGNQYPSTRAYAYQFVNNRRIGGATYDADGRMLQSTDSGETTNYEYDAAGRNRSINIPASNGNPQRDFSQDLDGDGLVLKTVRNGTIEYYFHSTPLRGKTLFTVDSTGGLKKAYVSSPSGETIARQEGGQVAWLHTDSAGVSNRETNSSGTVTSKTETDPLSRLADESPLHNYNGSAVYNNNPAAGFYIGGDNPYGPLMGRAGMLQRWFRNVAILIGTRQINTTTETRVCIEGDCSPPDVQTYASRESTLNLLMSYSMTLVPVTAGPTALTNNNDTCEDAIGGLPDINDDVGALARLVFLEATPFARFLKGYSPVPSTKPPQTPEETAKFAQANAEALSNAQFAYFTEMQAIAATVYNIKAFIDQYPASQYPDAAFAYKSLTGWESTVRNVIFASGQYEGFGLGKADETGQRPISLSTAKADRIKGVLEGPADTDDCAKLIDALGVARSISASGVPSDLKGIVGLRTKGRGSPGGNYQTWTRNNQYSGNVFFEFTQIYIDSILKSANRIR